MTFQDAGLSSDTIPPPSHVRREELTEAELARLHTPTKRPLFRWWQASRKSGQNSGQDSRSSEHGSEDPSTSGQHSQQDIPAPSIESEDMPFVKLGGSVTYSEELMQDYEKDVYRWAVIYENQRG